MIFVEYQNILDFLQINAECMIFVKLISQDITLKKVTNESSLRMEDFIETEEPTLNLCPSMTSFDIYRDS